MKSIKITVHNDTQLFFSKNFNWTIKKRESFFAINYNFTVILCFYCSVEAHNSLKVSEKMFHHNLLSFWKRKSKSFSRFVRFLVFSVRDRHNIEITELFKRIFRSRKVAEYNFKLNSALVFTVCDVRIFENDEQMMWNSSILHKQWRRFGKRKFHYVEKTYLKILEWIIEFQIRSIECQFIV